MLIKKTSMMIIGIECRTSNASEKAPHDIPKLWEKFYSEEVLVKIPNKTSSEVIALYCDYEGDHTKPYSLIIGCQVSSFENIPEGMVSKEIPASSFAVFKATGDYPNSLIKTWETIWQQEGLKRTFTGDYELYKEDFFSKKPQELEVFIAVED